MRTKFFAILALIGVLTIGCSSGSKEQMSEVKGKSLVVYYSQTGATKSIADEIARLTGADIAAIEAVEPYEEDYGKTVERWRMERDSNITVAINPLNVNLEDYDTIFLGFPVWGGTTASPMATFLKENSLKGKTVITFATFGSGGLESATADVAEAQPEAKVVAGYGVRNARIADSPAEIERFLIEKGIIEGTVEALPEYGQSEPVTAEDAAVFDAACGDYQFPLGTPVAVEKRIYGDTTDYKFSVVSTGPDGRESTSTIYVIVREGSAPVFTRVVR